MGNGEDLHETVNRTVNDRIRKPGKSNSPDIGFDFNAISVWMFAHANNGRFKIRKIQRAKSGTSGFQIGDGFEVLGLCVRMKYEIEHSAQ